MLDGATLTLWWSLPFAGVLFSLAVGPSLFKNTWHKVSIPILGCLSSLTILSLFITCGLYKSGSVLLHLFVADYIPFIFLISALYIISGGIVLEVAVKRSPLTNTVVLLIGTLCASIIGTTGAVMLFIRPLIHVNKARTHKAHIIIFIIILLGNMGGSLTPLGDPPLFLGYLKGVDFLWVPQHMLLPFLMMVAPLLGVFFLVDTFFLHKEGRRTPPVLHPKKPWLNVQGKINFGLLFLLILSVALIQSHDDSVQFRLLGVTMYVPNLLRDGILLCLAGLSLWITPHHIKALNKFSWHPLKEVLYVFFAIFVTVLPVLSILEAREEGALRLLTDSLLDTQGDPMPSLLFWITGLCSALLDNAPTYLVFLKATGLSVKELMACQKPLLLAISTGAVFMGALTYIGNAPNFLAKSIAQEYGIKMPGFLGYTLISGILLGPLFACLSYFFFQ